MLRFYEEPAAVGGPVMGQDGLVSVCDPQVPALIRARVPEQRLRRALGSGRGEKSLITRQRRKLNWLDAEFDPVPLFGNLLA